MELIVNAENHRYLITFLRNLILCSAKLIIEQFKEKSNLLNIQVETKLTEYKDKIRQLTEKLRSVPSTIHVKISPFSRETEGKLKDFEKQGIEKRNEYQELKENFYRLQEQNREYEHEIEELNSQLSLSLQARETLYSNRGKSKSTPTVSSSSRSKGQQYLEDESADEDEINEIINEIQED